MNCSFSFCNNQTDYTTISDDPICQSCADSNGYEVCTKCGKFMKTELTNGYFCNNCEAEDN